MNASSAMYDFRRHPGAGGAGTLSGVASPVTTTTPSASSPSTRRGGASGNRHRSGDRTDSTAIGCGPVHPLMRGRPHTLAGASSTSPLSLYTVGSSTSASGGPSQSPGGEGPSSGADGGLDANLRQLALLQALVARQQELVLASAGGSAHVGGDLSSQTRNRRSSLSSAAATPTSSAGSSTDHTTLMQAFHLTTSPDHARSSSSQRPQQTQSSWLDGLNSLLPIDPNASAAELAQAQQQLELWAQVSFTSQATTPAASSPTRHVGPLTTSTHTSAGETPNEHGSTQVAGEFDWSSFYPELAAHHISPSNTGLAPSSLRVVPSAPAPTHPSSPPASPPSSRPTRARSLSSKSNSASSSATKSLKPPATSTSRAGSPPLIDTSMIDELLEEEFPIRPPLTNGTPEEIEEDKRRRNTEASARFRARKKQRDALLLQTSAQLRGRAEELEKEKEGLLNENQWLRDLVAERKPGNVPGELRDVLKAASARPRGVGVRS